MSNIDKIRQEIERRKRRWMFDDLQITIGRYYEDRDLLAFIDYLPEDDPLNDQDLIIINKKDWEAQEQFRKNKDFGKPLQQEHQEVDLEEAADKFEQEYFTDTTIGEAFIAGAKWQANQLLKGSPLPEDTVLFQKGVEEGRRLERDDLALTWDDIKSIVQIADKMLDDPKARVEFQNHNDEYYYKRVLDEYALHKTKEE